MLKRHSLLTSLVLSLPISTFAQTSPTIPANPKPSKVMAALIAKAKKVTQTGKPAEAVALLETKWKVLPKTTTTDDRTALAHALADVYFEWAGEAEKRFAWKEAILNYQAAYQFDKSYRMQDAAVDINNIGLIYDNIGEKIKALEFYNQALTIFRVVNDKSGEARTLGNIGLVYDSIGEKAKALESLNQALPLLRHTKDKGGEAIMLNNIGTVYNSLGKKSKALEFLNQALQIRRAVGDKPGEAATLHNIGVIHSSLGEKAKALDFLNQTLPLLRQTGDKRGEAATLNNIGLAYSDLGEKTKALEFLNQALPVRRAINDKQGEATTLISIGTIYNSLGEKAKALEFLNQALPIKKMVGDKQGEAATLHNIGTIYSSLGEKIKALEFYNKALSIRKIVGDKSGEAITLKNLMVLWHNPKLKQRSPQMASLYGKQGVQLYQQLREDAQKIDNKALQSFTKTTEGTYRALATTLLEQGRLTEALQIIDLLKQQELFDFVGKQSQFAALLKEAPDKTDSEDKALKQYEALALTLANANTKVTELANLPTRTPAQEAQLLRERKSLEAANAQFVAFLESLPARFSQPIQDGEAKLAAQKAKEFQEALTGLDHTLVIYLVPTEDALHLILVTPTKIQTRKVEITQADLDKKLATFRAVLQNPKLDPRPLGKELYDILLKPIEVELTGIKTILWSLDGALRYIPVEALSPDGKGYLVERFAHARLTLAAKQRLTEKAKTATTALVAGASLGKGGVSPLPGVPSEVNAIASILPGQTLLDPTFTKASFLASLKKGYPLVHIATHFELGEQASQSALLLGDGTRLSLLELLEGGNAFVGVEQVTLSACSTAVGEGSGREVDSLAKVAELLGARSVLASLWPVNDSSTSVLMQRFYTLLKDEPGLGRGECLRRAQRELLSGKASSVGAARGPVAATGGKPPATVPAYIPDPSAPCAHPYYWAPFILIGNTR